MHSEKYDFWKWLKKSVFANEFFIYNIIEFLDSETS